MISGLYAITDSTLTPPTTLLDQVAEAINGGAKVIQYREKHAPRSEKHNMALALRALTSFTKTILIINDDVELAKAVDADGVHVGKEDASLAHARQQLGATKIIGCSCYQSLDMAITAATNGADYVAFGAVFPSTTKPDAAHADLAIIRSAKQHLSIPVVAIGGITADNVHAVWSAGADSVAVITGLFSAPDICAQARKFTA